MSRHFCINCLQGFHSEESRDKHFDYCVNNDNVKIEMPKEGIMLKFHDGQYQFKVPFTLYADFESILEPIKDSNSDSVSSVNPTLKKLINIYLLVFVFILNLHMEMLKIH